MLNNFYFQINQEQLSQSQKEVKSARGEIMLRVLQNSNTKKIEIPDKVTIELIEGQTLKIKVNDYEYTSQTVAYVPLLRYI